MRDENHLNELLENLHTVRRLLRAEKFFGAADEVDEAATQLRVLFDETGDLRIRIRELETENDCLRDDLYYMQDRLDEARERESELHTIIDDLREED